MQPLQGLSQVQSADSTTTSLATKENEETAFSLVSHMQSSFMTPLESSGKSLHQQTINLPFYAKLLRTSDITDKELLQHFVNNSAIFTKLESLIRLHEAFRSVFTDNIFRAPKAEEDIRFFIERFHLKRPDATEEVKDFLRFIDQVAEDNPKLLLPILYVQYAGLFLGRAVCGATAKWLAAHITAWEECPDGKKGLSYWDFDGLPTSIELQAKSASMLKQIDKMDDESDLRQRMQDIARAAFQHNYNAIKSAASFDPVIDRKVTTHAPGMSGEQKKAVLITMMLIVFAFLVNEALKSRSASSH
ncbi:biliverdin-producing heme oxygenase [Estrella lausannensis]|uniref:Heme oxygenase n=1 Tax=Estrella lausannensis TaxID=483423 RepID=A0A0H5E3C3_9BACT|nr:biliverdin-producing heme oxygenase [Estrella lausannensis]CRX37720.1 Heme oxygenase [Estrella lausannensis]